MALDSRTNASELTAEQVASILIQPLEQRSLFLAAVVAAGGTVIETAGPLRIPAGAAPTTPEWYAQNEQIDEEDTEFGELTLLPSNMKSVKTLTRYSNELLRQSIIALEPAVRSRLVTDVASVVDTQLFSASDGTTGVTGGVLPAGIFSYASGDRAIAVGGAVSYDDLIAAQGVALGNYVTDTGLRWVISPEVFTALRLIKAATGSNTYAVQPDLTRGAGFTILGTPAIVTDRVPAGTLGLVDFSKVVVARDVAPSVKILDQTFGDFDQQAIRVVMRLDAKPTHPEAVIALTGITTA